ncbi:YigZ family protein [Rhizobium sp. OAE497]|uniref:IMPACT family protein n=1 Tax=Rhizobium sp. OAE497 TaxID=2663796 RepID=UPI001A2EE5AA
MRHHANQPGPPPQMFVLKNQISLEQTVKKSRFLAIAIPVDSETAVKMALAEHSDPSANHNCYAWRVGNIYRFNDDGEPSGTAGKPIFQAIEGRQLDKTLVIVTRWFGGVLLGAGGLVRAYGGTAAACLREAELEETAASIGGTVHLSFQDLEIVRAKLTSAGMARVMAEQFDHEGCWLTLDIIEKHAEDAALLITNLTRGRTALKLDDNAAE